MNAPLTAEHEFTRKLGHALSSSVRNLDSSVTQRLHAARQIALAHQAPSTRVSVLALAGQKNSFWFMTSLQPLVMAFLLALAILAGNTLMSDQRISDLEDIDSALLTDDLPINAYLDSGFRSWLADPSSQR